MTATAPPPPPADVEAGYTTVGISATASPPPAAGKADVGISGTSQRAQWLRAAVLGAIDGILSTAALMVGVGAVKDDVKSMILVGFAGLLAGAFSMATGEFVSVYSQYDIELSQILREHKAADGSLEEKKRGLPSPVKAAAASAAAFAVGAAVPLLAAAFIKGYGLRIGVVVATVSVMLVVFGWLAAVLGRSPPVRSAARVLAGGLVAMGITYALTKLVGATGI